MKHIYIGVDQLDFTVNGTFKSGFLDKLKMIQETAKENDTLELFEFGMFKGLIGGTGGQGGWNYIVNNGSATYAIKNRGQEWSLKIAVRSLLLATDKYHGAIKKIIEQVQDIITIKDYRISRFDVAIDLQPNYWKLDADLFVKKGQMGLNEFYSFNENGKPYDINKKQYEEFKQSNVIECGRVFRKKNIETVMLGKLPNFQICIYNKLVQINKSPKFEYWRNVWRLCPEYDEKRPVWRFEFRFGRQYFKVRRINDFVDLRREIGKIIYKALGQVYMVEKVRKNNSRDGKTCKVWQGIRNNLFTYVNNLQDDTPRMVCMKDQLTAIKKRKIERNEKTIIGLSTGLIAMGGGKVINKKIILDKLTEQLDNVFNDKKKVVKIKSDLIRKNEEFEYLEYGLDPQHAEQNKKWEKEYERGKYKTEKT